MSGNSLKEDFRKVTDRIVGCLQNIQLAAVKSTFDLEDNLQLAVDRLQAAPRCGCAAVPEPVGRALEP